jgi:cytochrome c-type biogenesis protein
LSTNTRANEQLSEIAEPEQAGSRWRRFAAALAVLLALAGAVVGALLTGSDAGGINRSVEAASSSSGTLLNGLAELIPLGYAFGVGMVAAVNPCGFAMLPAYLALYLGTDDPSAARHGTTWRLGRALEVSASMTAGFVLLFGLAGLGLGVATSALARALPFLGVAVGILLVVIGGRLLTGATFYTSIGDRLADRLGPSTAARNSIRGYFAYGLAYGAASLGCTLPIFLTVVGSTLTSGGPLAALGQFVLYACGMGFVILLLTLSVAFFKQALVNRARAAGQYLQTLSAVLMLIAGAYLVYYWLTLGGLLAGVRLA